MQFTASSVWPRGLVVVAEGLIGAAYGLVGVAEWARGLGRCGRGAWSGVADLAFGSTVSRWFQVLEEIPVYTTRLDLILERIPKNIELRLLKSDTQAYISYCHVLVMISVMKSDTQAPISYDNILVILTDIIITNMKPPRRRGTRMPLSALLAAICHASGR